MTNEKKIEKELSFNEKVILIQNEVKAPKSQYSDYGGYNYRSCEDILKAVKPLNMKFGLLLQITDKPVVIGERFYIEATASLTDGKETLKVCGYAREALSKPKMDDSQVTGSASSYARKYALNGLYLIDDVSDADALNDSHNESQDNLKDEFIRIFNENIKKVSEKTGKTPEFLEASVLVKNGFESLDEITPEYYSQVIGYSKGLLMKAEQRTRQSQQTEPKKQSARDLFANGGKRA